MNRKEKRINIDGRHLAHVILAHDIVLIVQFPQVLQEMLSLTSHYKRPP